MESKFVMQNRVWTLEDYAGYICANYNSNFQVSNIATVEEFEEALEHYDVELWNYPLSEMDYVVECGTNKYYVVVQFCDNYVGEFEYRICEM